MGIQINGNSDNISATDGSLTISGASLGNVTGGLNVTSGSVGIGTDNPSWGLDLQRNANTQARFIRNDAGDSYLRVNSHTGNIVGLQLGDNTDVDKQMIRADNTNNALIFNTANGEKLRITSAGDVGIGSETPGARLEVSDGVASQLIVKNPGTNAAPRGARISFSFDDGEGAAVQSVRTTGGSTLNCDLSFRTGGVTNSEERLGIGTDGNISINNGNLVFSTAGTGIDFSATTDATGMDSELLDDYEEGTFTPTAGSPAVSGTGITYTGSYVKIGSLVWVRIVASASPNTDIQVSTYAVIEGLPFDAGASGSATGTVITEDIDVFSRQGFITKGTNNDRIFVSACGSASGTSNISMTIVYSTL